MTDSELVHLDRHVTFTPGVPPFSQGREAIGAHVAETHGDAVDWGHMKADVVQYGGADRRYDILADDSPPPRGAAAGRGAHPPVAGGPGGGRGPPPGEAALPPR